MNRDGPVFTAVASQGSWRWRRHGFSATAFPKFGGIRYTRSKLMKPVLTAATLAMGLGLAVPAVAQTQPNDPGRTSPLAQTDPGKESPLARSPCKGATLAQAAPRDAGREWPLVAQAAPRDAGRESPLVAQAAPRDAGRESPLVAQAAPRDAGRESPLVAQAAPRDAGRESPLVAQAAPRDPGKESALASADEALSPRDAGKESPFASA